MSSAKVIAAIEQLFARSRVRYSKKPIDDDFMYALLKAEGKKMGNPEFDPSLHELSADNSFWLGCYDRAGGLVATVAARLLQADDFLERCQSYRLWYGEKIRVTEPLNIVFSEFDRLPARSASFIGAGWVRPDCRGRGLSWALTRLAYYLAMERWNTDWVVGMSLSGIMRARIPSVNFGFPRIDLFATGFRLPGYLSQHIYMMTMTRNEASNNAVADYRFLAGRPLMMLDSTFGSYLQTQRHSGHEDIVAQPDIRVAS